MIFGNKIKQIGLYTLPSFLGKGISLILVPLYTTYLSVENFGQLELISTLIPFLQYTFQFGWGSAYLRLYNEPDIDTNDLSHTLLIFRCITHLIILLAACLIGFDRLAIFLVNDQQLGMAIAIILLQYCFRDYLIFYESRYRLQEKAIKYAQLNLAQALPNLVFILYFLVGLKMGINGILFRSTYFKLPGIGIFINLRQ